MTTLHQSSLLERTFLALGSDLITFLTKSGTRFLLWFSNFWRGHGSTFSCSITIPQDIIMEILYHLPTKSVGRFRCVSKEWLSLLSEPHFIKVHLQKTRDRNCFIFWSYDGSHYSVPFNHRKAVSRLAKLPVESSVVKFIDCVEFFGSCNGLIVLASLIDTRWIGKFVVVNLITRDYVEVRMFRHEWSRVIAHDSMTDDYKVVIIYRFLNAPLPYKSFVHVYSLRTRTWMRLDDQAYYYSSREGISGVFVNGFLHYIVNSFSKPGIVTFSLADEKFSELPSPSFYTNDVDSMFDTNSKIVALGEKLAIYHAVKGVVWLMNEYGVKESWTKIVVHGFNEIPMNKPEIFYDNRKLLFLSRNKMWNYDLEEGTFCEAADIFDMHLWRVKCAYVESLVSPKVAKSNYRWSLKNNKYYRWSISSI